MYLALIGSGGHCKVVIDAIESVPANSFAKHYVDCIADINYKEEDGETICGYKVVDVNKLGTSTLLYEKAYHNTVIESKVPLNVFISIGDNKTREKYFNKFKSRVLTNVIHSASIVSTKARLNKGIFINAGAIVNAGVYILDNVIINTGAIVDHDCAIGHNSHIAPGVKLAGRVGIGDNCLIGIGSSVIQNIKICDNVTVGAGSVVTKDITNPGTYVGIPARKVLDEEEFLIANKF